MIQDIVGALYLFWPVTILGATLFFIAGFLFAISIGGLLVIGLLIFYYLYIYLKKHGTFDSLNRWLLTKKIVVGHHLHQNIQETFVLKGDIHGIPEGPLLYIAHPHGLFSMAPFFHWVANLTQWPAEKKVRIAIHSIFFRIPIVRELCESVGAIEATEDEIRAVLEGGESVAILTGGVREISMTEPGRVVLNLKKRRGFAKIAKELGVPIVPVLTFGENELFPPIQGFWTDVVQGYLRAWLGIAIPIPTFASIRNWYGLVRGPLPAKVETWIGTPIQTKKSSIHLIRTQVIAGFEEIYREGRPEGFPLRMTIL
jgi:1-acyl-sn-glycerol-3-phosphate acyltransferase